MDIPNILKFMHPNAVWSVGEDYESLNWPEQGIEKPTLQQIIDAEPLYLNSQMIANFSIGIQKHIDAIAREKQYESSVYCATYATSTIQPWQQEALAFIEWRDSVWVYSLGELAKFQSGERPAVSFEEFVQELPVIAWPV